MAKKRVTGFIKFQIPAQKATPAQPVGPALGPHGLSAPQFVQQFNEASKHIEAGLLVPVIITVYHDRSFTFEIKSPPAAVLIKKEIGLESGSAEPHKVKVGKISREQLKKIAEIKMDDLNANTIDAAINIIAGTARSMGVECEE
ncbi:MAG: 50S ribosomal protein L11 [Salinispira sp.]